MDGQQQQQPRPTQRAAECGAAQAASSPPKPAEPPPNDGLELLLLTLSQAYLPRRGPASRKGHTARGRAHVPKELWGTGVPVARAYAAEAATVRAVPTARLGVSCVPKMGMANRMISECAERLTALSVVADQNRST